MHCRFHQRQGGYCCVAWNRLACGHGHLTSWDFYSLTNELNGSKHDLIQPYAAQSWLRDDDDAANDDVDLKKIYEEGISAQLVLEQSSQRQLTFYKELIILCYLSNFGLIQESIIREFYDALVLYLY